jgi:hypothetical protein
MTDTKKISLPWLNLFFLNVICRPPVLVGGGIFVLVARESPQAILLARQFIMDEISIAVNAPTVKHLMVRKPEQAEKSKDLGATIVEGDYFNYESILKAFKNTEELLLIGAPSLTVREEQHKNILRAVKASGVFSQRAVRASRVS